MRKMVAFALLACTCAFALCACSAGQTTVGAADNGGSVALSRGDGLAVRLDGSPGTGFGWMVTQVDRSVLTTVGEPEFKAGSSAIGASGTMTLRFKASGSGSTTLKLAYRRSWETTVPPAKTYDLMVTVR